MSFLSVYFLSIPLAALLIRLYNKSFSEDERGDLVPSFPAFVPALNTFFVVGLSIYLLVLTFSRTKFYTIFDKWTQGK